MKFNLRTRLALALTALFGTGAQCDSAAMDMAGGFEVYHNGELVERIDNIVPAAARSYCLKAAIAGFAQTSAWFVTPFESAVTPGDALTAANFEATLSEFTNYDELTRPAWTQDAEASQAIANAGSLATITCSAGGGTLNGVALMSIATKSSAAGLCLAASRFVSERELLEGDTLQFKYTMRNQAAA